MYFNNFSEFFHSCKEIFPSIFSFSLVQPTYFPQFFWQTFQNVIMQTKWHFNQTIPNNKCTIQIPTILQKGQLFKNMEDVAPGFRHLAPCFLGIGFVFKWTVSVMSQRAGHLSLYTQLGRVSLSYGFRNLNNEKLCMSACPP